MIIRPHDKSFDRELRRAMDIGGGDWNETPKRKKEMNDVVERHQQNVEATRIARQVKARKRIIKLLDRKTLEQLSHRETPWHADKATLESDVLVRWPATDIEEAVAQIMDAAR
jgi:hypothetical protein